MCVCMYVCVGMCVCVCVPNHNNTFETHVQVSISYEKL